MANLATVSVACEYTNVMGKLVTDHKVFHLSEQPDEQTIKGLVKKTLQGTITDVSVNITEHQPYTIDTYYDRFKGSVTFKRLDRDLPSIESNALQAVDAINGLNKPARRVIIDLLSSDSRYCDIIAAHTRLYNEIFRATPLKPIDYEASLDITITSKTLDRTTSLDTILSSYNDLRTGGTIHVHGYGEVYIEYPIPLDWAERLDRNHVLSEKAYKQVDGSNIILHYDTNIGEEVMVLLKEINELKEYKG